MRSITLDVTVTSDDQLQVLLATLNFLHESDRLLLEHILRIWRLKVLRVTIEVAP